MTATGEELVRVGEMFNSPDVVAQALYSLGLAGRDQELLGATG